jgi:DNA-binding HxlR family transcriptional regulator
VFTYNQYCPVAKSAEILGDRWTLLIVRELIGGTHRFNNFHRNLPGISRSVLTERLRRLEEMGVVARDKKSGARAVDYSLTEIGEDLQDVITAVGTWGARWIISDPTPREADPDIVMLWTANHVDESALPENRVVVEFEVQAQRRKKRYYWLVLAKGDVSLCKQYPGLEPDLYARSDAATLYRIYMGRTTWSGARSDGMLELEGPRALVRKLPTWLPGSAFAKVVKSRSDLD